MLSIAISLISSYGRIPGDPVFERYLRIAGGCAVGHSIFRTWLYYQLITMVFPYVVYATASSSDLETIGITSIGSFPLGRLVL